MKRKQIPLLVCAALFILSCTPLRDRITLNDIEALIPERPDSALAALRDMHPQDLPGLHVRPLHALLLSEALDKNYIDLTDDSLALAANRYYGCHGSKLHSLKSWYYLGRIRFNAGNYAEAVICYDKALDYAESLTDYHYIGLINREIANSYSEVWDSVHAIEYTLKAIDSFSSANEKNYILYCELALARLYRVQKEYDKSKEAIRRIIDNTNDDYLLANVHELEALIALSDPNNDLKHVSDLLSSAGIGSILPENTSRLCNIAISNQLSGKADSADYYLNKASRYIINKNDSISLVYSKYRIELLRNNYEVACSYLGQYVDLQDPALYRVLEQSLSFYQGHYYQEESRMNAMKTQIRTVYSLIVIVFLTMIVLFLFSNNRKQREQIMEEMSRTSEIKQDLLLMKNEKEEIGQSVASLFESRLEILQTLSNQYDLIDEAFRSAKKTNKSKLSREEVIDSFRNMMRDLRKDKHVKISIEEALNSWKNGIMRKFRHVFSEEGIGSIHMTKEDMELAPYFFSGMKYNSISYLTGHSEHAIRERKHRIKRKIEALGDSFSKEKQLFLDNL